MRPLCSCLILLGLLLGSFNAYVDSIGCIDNNGKPVDWFIVYKLPILDRATGLLKKGVGQAYMDSRKTPLNLLPKGIDETGHSIYYTLQQIYANKTKNLSYRMYNDRKPGSNFSNHRGHTKGVVAFDLSSGFWLVHSVPRFPPPASTGSGYSYPDSGKDFGQTFLCVTFSYKFFADIVSQLSMNEANFYDSRGKLSFLKDNHLLNHNVGSSTSEATSQIKHLLSSGGKRFTSFAKSRRFRKDLYHDLVAPELKSNLLTETWQQGRNNTRSKSDCSGPYQVKNILNVSILGNSFASTKDHSKWAVTAASSIDGSVSLTQWICIGDINRVESQKQRGGGTLCCPIAGAWKTFKSMVKKTEPCPQTKSILQWKL